MAVASHESQSMMSEIDKLINTMLVMNYGVEMRFLTIMVKMLL